MNASGFSVGYCKDGYGVTKTRYFNFYSWLYCKSAAGDGSSELNKNSVGRTGLFASTTTCVGLCSFLMLVEVCGERLLTVEAGEIDDVVILLQIK